jgi:hypothetical protein
MVKILEILDDPQPYILKNNPPFFSRRWCYYGLAVHRLNVGGQKEKKDSFA